MPEAGAEEGGASPRPRKPRKTAAQRAAEAEAEAEEAEVLEGVLASPSAQGGVKGRKRAGSGEAQGRRKKGGGEKESQPPPPQQQQQQQQQQLGGAALLSYEQILQQVGPLRQAWRKVRVRVCVSACACVRVCVHVCECCGHDDWGGGVCVCAAAWMCI